MNDSLNFLTNGEEQNRLFKPCFHLYCTLHTNTENETEKESKGQTLRIHLSLALENFAKLDFLFNVDEGKKRDLASEISRSKIGGKGNLAEVRSMVNEEAIQIEDVSNSNLEKENNAKSENIPEELTEKFVVKKGKGTPLKDICDVVSQLEKKVLSFSTTLHCILYGEHDKVEDFKKDVLEFSGFVCDGDEESQRDKVKERLERCTRDMLTQLCSVFDISVTNAFYGKNKKEIIELLLEFLEAPHDATEETESSHREKKLSPEMDTATSLEIVHEEENTEEDGNDPSNKPEEMRGSEKEENSTVSKKPNDRGVNLSKGILDMSANSSRGDPSFGLNAHSSSEKLTKSVWELEKSNKKQKRTERRVAQGGNKPPKEWCDPSCEEVQKAISIILEEIDITTATFSDVLEELDEHFEMDISPRKDSIMVMIEEELYRLANEAQEQESHEENQEEQAEEKQDGNENKNCIQVPSGVPVQI